MRLFDIFRKPAPPAETPSQAGIQARVIDHLVRHGVIDAWTIVQMGTTDAHKLLTRLRRKGYLFAADNPRGHFEQRNRSGHGTHRHHYWTGKRPPQLERRARVRGGR
ncbi:hypothetical protein [Mesorhizobium sp. B2-3-4]|uniref:hypothetical protein n=1 Tax=Mesorhizobium sp. B2-3-4 TaxID=2589959 RepID=UPI00112D48D9|nr:hypothetical protein [Mesorhizobium sp. B2-3-4]TPM41407.1 hypothetical protein FJ967_00270 [Mesorhizobium sp. B2-3-4]